MNNHLLIFGLAVLLILVVGLSGCIDVVVLREEKIDHMDGGTGFWLV